MRHIIVFLMTFVTMIGWSQIADSPWLYGIHWYQKTDSIEPGELTDVETMSGGKGLYILENVMVDQDANASEPWQMAWQTSPLDKRAPGYKYWHSMKAIDGKGHTLVYRIHPSWGRNVPHSSDPYTLAQYADDCSSAAYVLRDWCHIWQIGNEANLRGEDNHWDGSAYTIPWFPDPAMYAGTYVACRDAIHSIIPNTNPATQVVLMQPVSPGDADAVRFMDGNEFLWRQIDAVGDKSKIDGFALHGYAEPGGAEFGLEGYWDSIREQLMIIDQHGLGDRPVYITEFNKHMPNATEAEIGAKFLLRAFTAMHEWNTSVGGAWPGLPNHNIAAAMWFVYPDDQGWLDYSLKNWKMTSGGTIDNDPWVSFNYAAGLNYPAGAAGGGPSQIPLNQRWWEDAFEGATLDQEPGLPDWKIETGSGGSVAMTGSGAVRLVGNTSNYGNASIRTAGYVFSDFRAEIEFTLADAGRIAPDEANFDIRIREGSLGYSMTLYTAGSSVRTNEIHLRRTNNWGETIKSASIPGGLNTGDSFRLSIIADGSSLNYKLARIPSGAVVLDWTGPANVTDDGQTVGWIRLMTYNLREAQISNIQVGGAQWNPDAGAEDWPLFQ